MLLPSISGTPPVLQKTIFGQITLHSTRPRYRKRSGTTRNKRPRRAAPKVCFAERYFIWRGHEIVPINSYFPAQVTEIVPYSHNHPKKQALDRLLCSFIIKDIQPVSIVESAAFRQFLAWLDPRYVVPTRNRVWNVLKDMQVEITEVCQLFFRLIYF